MAARDEGPPGAGDGHAAFAARLRDLRVHAWPDLRVTQGQLAEALGTSVPTISSWESRTNTALPGEDRLQAYARFFATRRSVDGGHGRLLTDLELTDDEERRRRELIDELGALRDRAAKPDSATAPDTGALGGRFFYYPDGQAVRIIGRALPAHELRGVQYAEPWHPNAIESLWNGDMDATIEVFGHVRAENPTADVQWRTSASTTADDLTGHVILLGGGDEFLYGHLAEGILGYFVPRLELPLNTEIPPGGDAEYDMTFRVSVDGEGKPVYRGSAAETYAPRFRRGVGGGRALHDGQPQLEYDLALLARQPNPLNLSATVTICTGIFSRGTLGAVRALTDGRLRGRNEQYLRSAFGDLKKFCMLIYVPVFPKPEGAQTVTPDLTRPFHRVRSWT